MKLHIKLGNFYLLHTTDGNYVAQWKGYFHTRAFGEIPANIIYAVEGI